MSAKKRYMAMLSVGLFYEELCYQTKSKPELNQD